MPGPSDEFDDCDMPCYKVEPATIVHRRPQTTCTQPLLLTASFESASYLPQSESVERLYKEHFRRAEKRASICEYEQREKEAALKKLPFHPNLQLTSSFGEGRAASHKRQKSVTLIRRTSEQYFKDMMAFEAKRNTKLREMRKSF